MATTTPIWVVLTASSLGGIIGGLLALLGVVITQRHAKHHARAAWAREDAARSYEHRQAAYVDFTKEFHHWHRKSVREDVTPGEYEYFDPLLDRLARIQIFGTNEAERLANQAINALVNFVDGDDDHIPEVEDVLEDLWSEIRRDLLIPHSAQDSAALHR
jgi:hypothetical protein